MLFRRIVLLVTKETSFTWDLHLHSKLQKAEWMQAMDMQKCLKNIDGFPRCLFNNEDDGESIGSSHCLKNSYSVW